MNRSREQVSAESSARRQVRLLVAANTRMRTLGPRSIIANRTLLVAGISAALSCALLCAPVAVSAAEETPTLKEVLEPKLGGTGNTAEPSPVAAKSPSTQPEPREGEKSKTENAAPEGVTPRGAVRAFMEAIRGGEYGRADRYLDLRSLSGAARREEPETLARELGTVLNQTWWFDLESLSDDPEGNRDDGLAANRDEVHRIEMDGDDVPILLQRGRVDGERIWRFAGPTVSQVPALYKRFGYGPLAAFLPRWFFEWQLLGVQLWQWIGLFALLLTAGFAAWLIASAMYTAMRVLLRRLESELLERLTALARGPLRLAVGVLVFSGGKHLLRPSVVVRAVLSSAEEALLIIAVTWAFLRLVDVGVEMIRERLRERRQIQGLQLLPPGRKTLKALIIAMAILVTLDNFGFNVTALLAGLGVGGIAVALAAQKTLENLFGGFTLYADRPVQVGDFCRFGDYIGTVEEIGLRSTRIRTLDRTLVSVPNAQFAGLQLENYSKRDRMRYHPTIGLRYETTPDQLRYVLVEVRRMLYAHPMVDPDPARVRFVGFAAYSLDLEVFAYVDVTEYGEFLEVAEDLNLRILDIVEEAGTGFAFPSQTTYLEQGQPLSEETREEIEERVDQWREENLLYLPRFPEQAIEEVRDTLDYPVRGAPDFDAKGGHRQTG